MNIRKKINIKNKVIIIFVFMTLIGCKSKNYRELEKIVFTDKNKSFSIIIPKSWEIKEEYESEYSLLELKSTDTYYIKLIITSRNLGENETKLDSLDLINGMMNSSVEGLKSKDCKILKVGKAKEFKTGYPTFVITATTDSEKILITQWGTVVGDRNYSINLFTLNSEGNEELAEIARDLIESITILN